MAETPEPMQPQADADPATLAFEALREEVALGRRAVAGLSAERASIEIPEPLRQRHKALKRWPKCQHCVFRPRTGAKKS